MLPLYDDKYVIMLLIGTPQKGNPQCQKYLFWLVERLQVRCEMLRSKLQAAEVESAALRAEIEVVCRSGFWFRLTVAFFACCLNAVRHWPSQST